MAQDFHAAFGLGADDKRISTVDADGVALAAIQALYRLLQEKDEQLEALQQQVEELRARQARLEALESELAALRAALRTSSEQGRSKRSGASN